MADTFTEVSHQSWFSRIGNSIKGIIVGLLLFVVSFAVLFWNEGRAVRRYEALKEGASAVITVAADTLDPANDGKLVHITAMAVTNEILRDPTFDVSSTALKLSRNVEMYQWEEHVKRESRKKLGGGTETTKTYTYSTKWSNKLIRSSGFEHPEGHHNPDRMAYNTDQWFAAKPQLGAFLLTRSLVNLIDQTTPVPVGGVEAGASANTPAGVKAHNAGYYMGANPSAPQVGDLRIYFYAILPQEISIVSRQVNGTFEPYRAKSGDTVELLATGTHSAQELFKAAEDANRNLTWLLRGGGFLIMFIGIFLVVRPLAVVADVLPFAGSFVAMGAGIIAFITAGVLSAVTIAIAWIFYRPLLGITLLALAAAGIYALMRLRKKPTPIPAMASAPAYPPPPPPPPPVPQA